MKFALNLPISRKVVFTGIDKRDIGSYLLFKVKGLEKWIFAFHFDFGTAWDSTGKHTIFCLRGYASKGTDFPVMGKYEINKTLFNYRGKAAYRMNLFDRHWNYVLRAITQLIKRIDKRGYLQ